FTINQSTNGLNGFFQVRYRHWLSQPKCVVLPRSRLHATLFCFRMSAAPSLSGLKNHPYGTGILKT
ncbi:hypothetical protein, partial [Escherichia coli]|uniref:hypothetical protein n=1 Tax=Escherichia coli TaxID=562 RepID=UPI002B250065